MFNSILIDHFDEVIEADTCCNSIVQFKANVFGGVVELAIGAKPATSSVNAVRDCSVDST